MQFKISYDPVAWLNRTREAHDSVAKAAVAALREVSSEAIDEGRDNIAGSGAFGPKWQKGLMRRMVGATEGGQPSLEAKAVVFHKAGLAGVFEHGMTIAGKPLLWIPTDPNMRGRPASRSGKKLVSATINGLPVLFDAADKDRHRKPLYIGVPAARIPKKWRITEIVKKHAAQLGSTFLQYFKDE